MRPGSILPSHPSMLVRTFLVASLLILCSPAVRAHEPCNLQIGMSCSGSASQASCVATTRNAGSNSCDGQYIVGYFLQNGATNVQFGQSSNTLGLTECFDGALTGTPQTFILCFGNASLPPGGSFTSSTMVTSTGSATNLPLIAITYVGDEGEELAYAYAFNGIVAPTCTPVASVPAIANSGIPYSVTWAASLGDNPIYEIQESTSADFTANLQTATSTARSRDFRHDVTVNTTYYYRVRTTNCPVGESAFSPIISVVVQAPPLPSSSARGAEVVAPFGSTTPVPLKLLIKAPAGKTALDTAFNATVDKPYMTVSPASGTIPPQGLTLTVTASPATLPPGANTATVTVTSGASTIATVPVSVSLVTPVAGGGKSPAGLSSLIIPVVTHVNSASGQFLSDVRLTNADVSPAKYQVIMTPTATDATLSSKTTTIDVAAGQTIALNDIAKNFFGFGATGVSTDVGFGSLEIRPIGTSGNSTYASSRTYATTPTGTFGQFIAAVPLSQFATNAISPVPGLPQSAPRRLMSLQQVAQSAKFRTNLGIVEGSGSPASGRIRFLDGSGTLLREIPFSLLSGEHRQYNSIFAANGLPSVEDGRIEIAVDSAAGAVTAYASVLDNKTTDPLAVMPAFPSEINENRYVLPGMAGYTAANFRSDIRLFNGGTSDAIAILTFYPQGAPSIASAPVRIAPGRVLAYDDVVGTLFSRQEQGGSIVVTTGTPSSMVVTGRTYSNAAGGGTYGQFIPGVAPRDGIGLGNAPLQVLQLEQSKNFRTNLGLAELSGLGAKVRVTVILPDSLATPSTVVDLAPNQFVQLNRVIESVPGGSGNVYNARVTVQVIEGAGRVAAYGSVIDNATSDPTYVPAQ